MARTKAQRLENIHDDALIAFNDAESAARDQRTQCLEDRRFYTITGAMWEGDLADQFDNKPKFEINKILKSVIRIFNDYRQNRITVDYVSKTGDTKNNLAEVCDDLFRADSQDSDAEAAFDNAFEEGVGGGYGAFRLRAEFEDEFNEQLLTDEERSQRIGFEPIYDADSTVFFSSHKKQDASDAKKCWVLTGMSISDYEDTYDDDPSSWPKTVDQSWFDWIQERTVYIAEYYRVEDTTEVINFYKTLNGDEERYTDKDFEKDEDLKKKLKAIGTKRISSRGKFKRVRVKTRRIHKYIMSGAAILEDCGFIAGRHIPVVPFYGKRWFIDNIERMSGHVRQSKDVQRLKNMEVSKLAEISALSPVEKAIVTPQQIAGHEARWANDNVENFPYLLLNPIIDKDGNEVPSGPVAYTRPPAIPPATAAMMQITDLDMKEMLGGNGPGEEEPTNLSGNALELIYTRMDEQTFIYITNMAKSMKRCGQIWLSMAREVYFEPDRKIKGITKQGEARQIQLVKKMIGEDQEVIYENDIPNAVFDVAVSVGPSSTSKKAATVRNITGMMRLTTDPETQMVLSLIALMNMEGEGIDQAQKWVMKRLVDMGVIPPNEEQQKEIEAARQAEVNAPPTPEEELIQSAAAEAAGKGQKAQADAQKSIAEIEETEAKTDKIRAETVEIAAGTERGDVEQTVALIDALEPAGTTGPQ